MDEVIKWDYENKAHEIVDILNERAFDAHYAKDVNTAKELVESLIPDGSSIAVGGSVTLRDTGILEEIIRKPKYNFIDRYNCANFDEVLDKYRQGFTSDVFVQSVNAVTKDGQLVCMDCTGNRAAAMIFGPKRVIVVMGVNKICDTLEDAIARCRKIAPLNVRRLPHKKALCYEDGICKGKACKVHDRVCNNIGIVDGCFYTPGRISVIVVPEVLGY